MIQMVRDGRVGEWRAPRSVVADAKWGQTWAWWDEARAETARRRAEIEKLERQVNPPQVSALPMGSVAPLVRKCDCPGCQPRKSTLQKVQSPFAASDPFLPIEKRMGSGQFTGDGGSGG